MPHTDRTLPAEWARQDAILITWPHSDSAWQDQLDDVEQTYFDLVASISHYQDLIIQLHPDVDSVRLMQRLSTMASDLSHCHFVEAVSNDTWARDHGPITVVEDNHPVILNFSFNGWGNKFPANLDNQLNRQLIDQGVLRNGTEVPWVLEGGSIESDGSGTVMTTEACLLNKNRNGDVSKTQMTEQLQQWFGCKNVLWLENGHLEGDDTDAHIDTLARFAPGNIIIFQGCQTKDDSHYGPLAKMKAELSSFKNIEGEPYQLLELPFPEACYAEDGHRLPATYANFLICNRQVIVPEYGCPADHKAKLVIEQAFPDHFVVGVNARPLIEEHGSIHCITMQLPQGSVNFDTAFLARPNNH